MSPSIPAALILLHIPKTAGRTLRHIIEPKYSAGERIRLYGNESLASFRQLSPEHKTAYKFVVGHLMFGLHRELAAPATYITMLRNPVSRAVSLYRFILRTSDHHQHAELVRRGVTLEQFVADQAFYLDNGQTRMLANWSGKDPAPPEALEQAQQNLVQHFPVAGLTERFDESLLLICRQLGWQPAFYLSTNIAPGSFVPSREAVEMIQERNRLDHKLYQFASRRLSTAAQEVGPVFLLQARLFHLANRTYNYSRASYSRLRSQVSLRRLRSA